MKTNKYLLLIIIFLLSLPSMAAKLYVHGELGNTWLSNIFLTSAEEADYIVQPAFDLEISLKKSLATGYLGKMEIYTMHQDLLFHEHEVFFFFAPSLGEQQSNIFYTEISLLTQQNLPAYQQFNMLRPMFKTGLIIEPRPWLHWETSLSFGYNFFYYRQTSSSIQSWLETTLEFVTAKQSIISPRLGFGIKHYPRVTEDSQNNNPILIPVTDDMEIPVPSNTESDLTHINNTDKQLEAQIYLSKKPSANVTLETMHTYFFNFGKNTSLQRQTELDQFLITADEQFLYSGYLGDMRLSASITDYFSLLLDIFYEYRYYNGWQAYDQAGEETGKNREDHKLAGSIFFEYRTAKLKTIEFFMGLGYEYLKQWSNDPWYDTHRHLVHFVIGFDL